MNPKSLMFALAAAVSLAVSPSMAGAHDALEVTNAFVRAPVGRMATAAAYFMVKNTGGAPDRLLAAATPAADKAELHGHQIDAQGIARMRPVPALEVPAGGTVELKPGGLHVMLIGLTGELKAGATVPLTLTFEHAGQVTVEVPVVSMSATGPAGMGGMGHGQMQHGTMGHGAMPSAPKTTN